MAVKQALLRRLASAGIALALSGTSGLALAQSVSPTTAGSGDPASMEALWSARLAAVERHIESLIVALPGLPSELERLFGVFLRSLDDWSLTRFCGAVIVVILSAAVAAFGFRRATGSVRTTTEDGNVPDQSTRLRRIAVLAMLNFGEMAVAALAAIAAFLVLHWPAGIGLLVLPFLAAAGAVYLVAAALRTAFGPGRHANDAIALRMVPLTTSESIWWRRRLVAIAAILFFGWAFAAVLGTLGARLEIRQLVVYAIGIGIVAVVLDTTWRRLRAGAAGSFPFARLAMTLLTLAIWFTWVLGAKTVLNLLLIGTLLCLAILVQRIVVRHLFRPADNGDTTGDASPVLVVAIDRLVRAVLVIGAVVILLDAWRIDFVGAVSGSGGPLDRLVQSGAHALVIVLLIDLSWSVLNAMIEKALAGGDVRSEASGDAARREARMRTLLPILRNVVGIVLVVLGVLMALAAFGVEIGPLIAGAGVIGVAVGFGAQTLVKDVFSGIFYLLDDSFRVGEYIQSGNYKGVVESFSLRSVKLRHHRGPLFTVPFGELGAIQNMSRDWVIDKMVISLAYGSDFDKAKKIVKQIGRELAEDADLGPDIIEPLKMQGVEQFGDFGVAIRLKVMTKPGKQFVLRRRANALIKKRFEEAGIHFAIPVVQVSGEAPAGAAAAHQAATMLKGGEKSA